jgi:hypothetical protein
MVSAAILARFPETAYSRVVMAAEGESRRKYLTLEAVDPVTGLTCEVLVSYDRMQAVARRSIGQAKECGHLVPMILQKPTAIFEGLRRDEDEDRRGFGWRCYCGLPERAYRVDGTERPPYPSQVYLVFVNDEHVAYNWRWEPADADNPRLPENYQQRFKRNLL